MTTPTTALPLEFREFELEPLIHDQRARRAFDGLGVKTVGDFLELDKELALQAPGLGFRSYESIEQRVQALVSLVESLDRSITGEVLRDSSTEEPVEEALQKDEAPNHPVAELAEATPQSVLGEASGSSLDFGERHSPWRLDRALDALCDEDRGAILSLLRAPSASPVWLAPKLGVRPSEAEQPIEALRERVRDQLGTPMQAVLISAHEELQARGGAIAPFQATPNRLIGQVVRDCRDPEWPLLLCAFLEPERLHWDAGRLLSIGSGAWQELRGHVRRTLRQVDLPMRREAFERVLDVDGLAERPALFEHLIRRHTRKSLRFRSDGSECVVRRRRPLVERIENVLREVETPLTLDDLSFRFRDRYGSVRRHRIVDALRRDRRFLELGFEIWALRERHVDELELARPLSEELRDRIRSSGERATVAGPSQNYNRTDFLAADLLRRDPGVRSLGRGVFCPRHGGSPMVKRLVEDLRRATGAVPFARFLSNLDPDERRLASSLLRRNRAFISPERDRVDLLENYPLQGERMRWLMREVELHLSEGPGYASVGSLRDRLEEVEVGGAFLTEHLLLDVLRRHSKLDLLPGHLVAEPSLRLSDWIRSKCRTAIRTLARPLTADEITAACPELAEFREAVPPSLDLDPLLHTPDRMHYEIV